MKLKMQVHEINSHLPEGRRILKILNKNDNTAMRIKLARHILSVW